MAFPEEGRTPGETVHLHIHSHWHTIALPVFWAVILTMAFGFLCFVLPAGQLGTVLLVLLTALFLFALARLAVWPFAVWRATQFAFTNERVMMRKGVFKVSNSDVPLNRLDNVSSEHGLLDRLMRCGTLSLGPSSDPNAHRLEHIPNVKKVQVLVNVLIRASGHKKGADVNVLEKTVGTLVDGVPDTTGSVTNGTVLDAGQGDTHHVGS